MKNEATIGGITVAGQPSAEELTSGRFKTIVNIRLPDEDGNITDAALAGTGIDAVAAGWTIGTVTHADIDRIREAVEAADGDVLVH